MSGLQIIVTDAGRQALINADNTGTLPVRIASIGVTAEVFVPQASQTQLPGEIKQLDTFAGNAVADNTLHVIIRDDGPDTYTLRGFGLYLQDGTLFAVYGQSGVILEKSTQATLLLAADVCFTDINATDLSFGDTSWINPPATTETPGVAELATDAEQIEGADASRASTPRGVKAALDDRLGQGAPKSFGKTLLAQDDADGARQHLGLGDAATQNQGPGNGLHADKLDGEEGSYYLNWENFTDKPLSYPPAAHSHAAASITSGIFAVARIPALDAGKITSGTFSATRIPPLSASKITSDTFDTARIPALDAGKITTGTLGSARIPSLSASKITSGTFNAARIPTLSTSKISGLQAALDAKASLGASVTFNNITSNSGNHHTPASRHYFDKQVQANGGFKVYSSRFTKKNIRPLQLGFEVLRKLRPVRYQYRQNICRDQRPRLGFVAEEVKPLLSEPVADDGRSLPAMDYDQMLAPVVGWLQLLDSRLLKLEKGHA
ncbi:tail fiber domain-containing protein [Microbulbifer sp. TYP-18]|uniref:tail fiber domain-containing protein n=1 Tax=Microbulbifer sp. TYP-18 TaxID=3230024 RepID=UPI0034C662E2